MYKMIDYRIKDFEQVKKIFIACMKKYSYILKWPQNELEEKISVDISCPTSNSYPRGIEKYLVSLLENLEEETNKNEPLITFDGTKLTIYEHHFCMLSRFKNLVPDYYQDIFRVLRFYGLIRKTMHLNKAQIEKIFKYGIYLYILPSYKKSPKELDERWFKQLEEARNHFNNIHYTIGIGELVYTNNSHKLIQSKLEKNICLIGGINFLHLCKVILLKPSFNVLLDRYQISRHKKTYTLPNTPLLDAPIPVYYLIQLGLKNIEKSPSYEISDDEKVLIFHRICSDAIAYMHLLNISSESIYEDLMLPLTDIPRYMVCNLIYDSLLTPDQYSIDYLLTILKNVFLPLARNESLELENWVNKYYILAKKVLRASKEQFSTTQLKRWSELKNDDFNDILSKIIIDSSKVNKDFLTVGIEPNAQLYPLIRLTNGNLYLFDAHISAYGFYCCLHNHLKNVIRNFNEKLGNYMEIFIRNMLNKNGWKVKNGSYKPNKKETQECDGFIEDNKNIVGIEMKYCRLIKDYSTGNDVALFDILGRGMLKAFKQNLQHWYDLINLQEINLKDPITSDVYNLSWQSRRLISVSICSSEYRFLTSHTVVHKLLCALINGSFGTYSPQRINELKNFLATQKQVRALISKFSNNVNQKETLDKIVFDTLFLSAPEFYFICKSKANNPIKQLIHLLHISSGTLDTYTDLILLDQ